MAVMRVTTLMVTLIMQATWQTSLVGAGLMLVATLSGLLPSADCIPSPTLFLLLTGVAVMAVMLVTTLMVTLIMLATWQTSLVGAGIFYVFYTFVEGVFWSANLYRVSCG